MVLQAESISLFLNPCTHWVVVNEPTVDMDLWSAKLAPYYTRHTLRLMTWDWNSWPYTVQLKSNDDKGYRLQQAIKLIMHEHIQKDYVCLDSKNFFITPTNINQYTDQIGSGTYMPHASLTEGNQKSNFISTVTAYSQKLQSSPESGHILATTPFVISYTDLMSVPSLLEIIRWFYQEESVNASEFILYGCMLAKQGINIRTVKKQVPDYVVWKKQWNQPQEFTVENFLQFINRYQYRVMAFGRNFLNQLDPAEFGMINNWLASRGFRNTLPYHLQERYTQTKGWIR
jgi:hypothetical protein